MPFSETDNARRETVIGNLRERITANVKIALPPMESAQEFALQSPGLNDYSGEAGDYVYQFEGEDDLLHLVVARKDQAELSVAEAQVVADFLLPHVPRGTIWLKPGTTTQHFYLGHEQLLP